MTHLDEIAEVASKPVLNDRAGGGFLSVTARGDARCLVAAVHGEIDRTTGPLLHDLLLAHVRSTRHLVVDLGEVGFLGAAGLTVLLVVRDVALLTGHRLCLVARTRRVRRPMTITGLDDVVDLHPDLAGALACRATSVASAG